MSRTRLTDRIANEKNEYDEFFEFFNKAIRKNENWSYHGEYVKKLDLEIPVSIPLYIMEETNGRSPQPSNYGQVAKSLTKLLYDEIEKKGKNIDHNETPFWAIRDPKISGMGEKLFYEAELEIYGDHEKTASITERLDRIASELELVDPRIALAIDQVSDRLEGRVAFSEVEDDISEIADFLKKRPTNLWESAKMLKENPTEHEKVHQFEIKLKGLIQDLIPRIYASDTGKEWKGTQDQKKHAKDLLINVLKTEVKFSPDQEKSFKEFIGRLMSAHYWDSRDKVFGPNK